MLRVEGVTVRFGHHTAVDAVDLRVDDGHVLAVLGPSGSGKSSLLRAVAGLEPLAAGLVRWDGDDLAGVPTHKRGFALMFQDGQLFDHLTVARNVGYALRLRGVAGAVRARRGRDLLELVGLDGYADRLPRTLSGGERQRVALARSLAAKPRLLLLDEPLSALDAELRVRLAADLRRILREAGTTALLVTHDQEEAFAVADRLAVMRDGAVVQQGTTAEVWSRPADAATALFLGYARVLEGDAAAAVLAAAGLPRAGDRRTALGARGAPASRRRSVPVTFVRPCAPSGPLPTRCDWSSTSKASVRRRRSGRRAGCPPRVTGWCCGSTPPASPSCRRPAAAPRLPRVYRRAYTLLIGTAAVMGAMAVFVAIEYDRPAGPGGQLPRTVLRAAAAALDVRLRDRPDPAHDVALARSPDIDLAARPGADADPLGQGADHPGGPRASWPSTSPT